MGTLSTVRAKTVDDKPAHPQCVPTKCEAKDCVFERDGGTRMGTLSTVRAKTVDDKPAHPECVPRTCELGEYCKVIPGGRGTKADVRVPSLTSPGEYRHTLCSQALSFDPTDPDVGCAVCGKKYYLSSTRAEVMKYEAEANGLIEYIDNYDSITKGNAHMGCWRKIRNDAVKKKERREEEALRNRARNMSAEEWHAELEDLMKEAEEIMARMNVQR